MAYVRGGGNTTTPSTTSTIMPYEQILLLSNKEEKEEEEMEEGTSLKPLVLFGIDLSFLSPTFRYFVLACGMFFFMCLYGYFQELVVYGWFQRKLSIFSTFLHFLGSSVFAQLQYHYSTSGRLAKAAALAKHNDEDVDMIEAGHSVSNHYNNNNNSGNSRIQRTGHSNSNNNSIHHHRDIHDKPTTNNNSSIYSLVGLSAWVTKNSLALARMKFTMGTAPPRLAFGYYVLLVFLKTATQGFTTACMSHINYPAKVLFKSANPIITMCIGLCWFRKTYPTRDYLVVALLVLGLYVFMSGDAKASPKGTGYGIFLVTLSMFGSAGVPMVQEHCMAKYNASIEELLYHCYLGSTGISFLLALTSGELIQGISFLVHGPNGSIGTWISFAAFCTFGYCGANFGAALTMHFGSLVNGITNTARKAVTLALSFAMFPERNTLTLQHIAGAGVFFVGLIVRTVMKEDLDKGKQDRSETGASSRASSKSTGASNNNWLNFHRNSSIGLSYGDLTSMLNKKENTSNNSSSTHNHHSNLNHDLSHSIGINGDAGEGASISSWGGYIINDERRGVNSNIPGDHLMSSGATRKVLNGEHSMHMVEPVSTTSTDSQDGLGYPRPPTTPTTSSHPSSHHTPSHTVPSLPYSTPSKPSSNLLMEKEHTLSRPLKTKKNGYATKRDASGHGLGGDNSLYTFLGGESVYVGSPVTIAGVMNTVGELRGSGLGGDNNGGVRDRHRAVNTTV